MKRILPGATSCSSWSGDRAPNNLSARSTLDFHPRSAESMSDFSIIILLPASPLSVLLIEPTSDIGHSVPIKCSIEILRNVPDMRSREYVVHRSKRMLCWQGFFIEDVDRGSGYCVRLQRLDQRWFINNRPARRVDQAGRWLDQFEFGSSDQVLCAGTQDEVDH